jgi:hypothetical protein
MPGERFSQHADEDLATAMAVDEEQRQARVAEAPGPSELAVDPPAGLVLQDHGGSAKQFQELVDHGGEQSMLSNCCHRPNHASSGLVQNRPFQVTGRG